jgi:uncharacterized protein YhfF
VHNHHRRRLPAFLSPQKAQQQAAARTWKSDNNLKIKLARRACRGERRGTCTALHGRRQPTPAAGAATALPRAKQLRAMRQL